MLLFMYTVPNPSKYHPYPFLCNVLITELHGVGLSLLLELHSRLRCISAASSTCLPSQSQMPTIKTVLQLTKGCQNQQWWPPLGPDKTHRKAQVHTQDFKSRAIQKNPCSFNSSIQCSIASAHAQPKLRKPKMFHIKKTTRAHSHKRAVSQRRLQFHRV